VDIADLVRAMSAGAALTSESMQLQGIAGWRARAEALGVFVLGGLAWLGVEAALAVPERPEVSVVVARGADAEARARAIDEAVLLEAGLQLGWRTDPLVRDRLARSLAAMTPSDVPWLDRAEALGLHRRDPLVRARLVERARRLLPGPAAPSPELLATWYAASGQRFARPAVVHYEQRFATDAARAEAIWLQVQGVVAGADAGEPELQLGPRGVKTATVLARVLGERGVAELLAAPRGTWVRLRSQAGHHLVRAMMVEAPVVPPLEAVRAEVLAAWRSEQAPKFEAAALEALRAKFEVRVQEVPEVPAAAKVPKSPDMPAAESVPNAPGAGKRKDMADMPVVPEVPGSPAAGSVPEGAR
jgi:hypothetical protein